MTRRPRLTLARVGFSDGSKASSVIENSVTRTGTTRFALQTNSTSGASGGRISSVPEFDSEFSVCSSAVVGLTSASRTASCGAMPYFTAFAF